MHRITYIVTTLIAIVFGVGAGYWLRGHAAPLSDKTVPSDQLVVSGDMMTDEATYRSERYLFSLRLPSTMAYAGLAGERASLFGARFSSGGGNVMALLVFNNPQHLRVTDEPAIRTWIRDVLQREIQSYDTVNLERLTVIRTTEVSGMGGEITRSYYVFGPTYTYAFQSSGYPDEAMTTFLSGFSLLGTL